MLAKVKPGSWHKEPFVWLVIGIPLVGVIGGIGMAIIAAWTFDGLVVDDYYKRGLEINQVLKRDRAAARYGLAAQVQIDEATARLRVILTASGNFTPPAKIKVAFLHATRDRFDRHLTMSHDADGVYNAGMPPLINGKWHVLLEGNDWRLIKQYIKR